tara:strand:+ start:3011 stop:3523 length:513 start_codon:yes stop_codon:yes gene_type:complete
MNKDTNYLVDMIVEIPYNSFVKYEFDKVSNMMRCDRVLTTSMLYPGNYGYIPNTLSGDNDPIDILMICDYPIYPGVIVNVKIIGILLTEDENGDDEKLIAVPSNKVDTTYNEVIDLKDLSKCTTSKIMHFFKHYKDTDKHKWVKVKNFENKETALQILQESRLRFSTQSC